MTIKETDEKRRERVSRKFHELLKETKVWQALFSMTREIEVLEGITNNILAFVTFIGCLAIIASLMMSGLNYW